MFRGSNRFFCDDPVVCLSLLTPMKFQTLFRLVQDRRGGIKKRESKRLFFLGCSQMLMKVMSFQLSLENCQGFSILDGGEKIITPARNGEQKCSGK